MLVTSCIQLFATRWTPTRLLYPWNSPGKNTGVGCHSLLQGNKTCKAYTKAKKTVVVRLWSIQVREVTLPIFTDLKSKGKNLCASKVALVLKNLPANTGDIRDTSLIPGSGRSPGGGHGNSFQYSCLKNPMDRGAYNWQATIHGVAKSLTRLGN